MLVWLDVDEVEIDDEDVDVVDVEVGESVELVEVALVAGAAVLDVAGCAALDVGEVED